MSVTWYILHVLRSSQIISLWCSCLGYIIITNDFCPSPWLFKAMSPYRRHPLQKRFTEYCSRRSLLCRLKDCTQPWVWFLMGVTCQDRWHGCFSVSLFSSRCKASTYWPIQTLLAHAYWLIWAQETNHSPGIITKGAVP